MQLIECADYGGPYRGSWVPMLAATAREAGRRDYPTTVLLPEIARGRAWLAELDGLADIRFLPANAARIAGARPVMRVLRSLLGARPGPAVIHTHFATFDVPAALTALRRRELAVFWHEHGPIVEDPVVRLRNMVRYGGLGRLIDGMLCVSPELLEQLAARGAPRAKLRDFPNAIDTEVFAPITAAERAAARRSLHLADDARVVLHFGWSWERKGGDLMLAAAEELVSEPEVVFLTVLSEDPGAIPDLAAHANVRPLHPTDDIKRLYAAADVFLSASRAEGALPLAALEALACGLPLIVNDIPVQRRLLDGVPGALAVTPDGAAIADAARRLLSLSEAELAAHREFVDQRFRTWFALDGWARRLLDLCEFTLDRPAS
jgi:glycosyltransferase involved in cell wall biosynthesis